MHYRLLIKNYCCNIVIVRVYENVLGERKALSVKGTSKLYCKMCRRVIVVCDVFFHREQRQVQEYVC